MTGKIEPIDYFDLTRMALRGVMSSALSQAAENGLVDDQHFYITFRTRHPGVVIPDWLAERYADEMTIVIQHEYWDLAVMSDRFAVGLSFNNRSVTLVIPFAAVKTFADPSVNFQLDIPMGDEDEQEDEPLAEIEELSPDEESEERDNEAATVVSLDSFRKK